MVISLHLPPCHTLQGIQVQGSLLKGVLASKLVHRGQTISVHNPPCNFWRRATARRYASRPPRRPWHHGGDPRA